MLTAGLGTRLRPLTSIRAKPAVPVAGEPLVRRILRGLTAGGVGEAVLNLHHLPHTITAVVGDGGDLGLRVRYSFEPRVLGSAGGPRKALPLLPASGFFIVNGDTLTDVDLTALAAQHRATGALVTIAVIPNDRPDRYGGLIVDAEGRFHSVVPRGSHVRSYHVVGVQAAQPEAFAALPPDVPVDSIGQHYTTLVAANRGHVRAFLCQSAFWDVGTPRDYLEASLAIAAREGREQVAGAGSVISPDATIRDSILWDDVVVGERATLDRCIVADGVEIPAGARYREQVLVRQQGTLVTAELT